MVECKICNALKGKVLFQTDKVFAFFSDSPSAIGHVIVAPKNHTSILEQVPDFIVSELFTASNKISSVLFDALSVKGTNILINNGESAGQISPHFSISILPRNDNDGLNFQWQPRQLNEENLESILSSILPFTGEVGAFEKEKEAPREIKGPEEKKEDKENYLFRQLRRLP